MDANYRNTTSPLIIAPCKESPPTPIVLCEAVEGRIMAELYPGKKLQVIVLDASGLSCPLHRLLRFHLLQCYVESCSLAETNLACSTRWYAWCGADLGSQHVGHRIRWDTG